MRSSMERQILSRDELLTGLTLVRRTKLQAVSDWYLLCNFEYGPQRVTRRDKGDTPLKLVTRDGRLQQQFHELSGFDL